MLHLLLIGPYLVGGQRVLVDPEDGLDLCRAGRPSHALHGSLLQLGSQVPRVCVPEADHGHVKPGGRRGGGEGKLGRLCVANGGGLRDGAVEGWGKECGWFTSRCNQCKCKKGKNWL